MVYSNVQRAIKNNFRVNLHLKVFEDKVTILNAFLEVHLSIVKGPIILITCDFSVEYLNGHAQTIHFSLSSSHLYINVPLSLNVSPSILFDFASWKSYNSASPVDLSIQIFPLL